MKHLKFLSLALISGFFLVGCGAVAHIEKDESVNFAKYKSFAWVETKEADGKPKGIDLQERNIREAVNNELAKQGWREAKSNPDVLLTYDVLVEKAVRENSNPVYSRSYSRMFYNPYTRRWGTIYYPSQFLGYDRDAYEVREGTVTISMIDAQSEKTIWQGWTTDEVNSRNLTSREIQQSVRSIFRKFDVAKN